MKKLSPTRARILKALHGNAGIIPWSAFSVADRRVGTSMEKEGLCRWIIEVERTGGHRLEITPKGIEALKVGSYSA